MSRNIGKTQCDQCGGRVVTSEPPRRAREAELDLSYRSTFGDEPANEDLLHGLGVISSVRVEYSSGDERVELWNRGTYCGRLTVAAGDGERIRRRLLKREDANQCKQ